MTIFKKPSRFFSRTPSSPLRATATGSHPSPSHTNFSPIRRPRRKIAHSSSSRLMHVPSVRNWLGKPTSEQTSLRPDDISTSPRSIQDRTKDSTPPETAHGTSSIPDICHNRQTSLKRNRTLSGRLSRLHTKFRPQSRGSTVIDSLPFALRSQTMVPLSVAAGRSDIRLRQEGFEMSSLKYPQTVGSHPDALSSMLAEESPALPFRMSISISEPSIYSENTSNPQLSRGDESYSSVTTSFSMSFLLEISGYTNYSLDQRSSASTSIGDLGDPEGLDSSFNENSFLRIAATELGW